MPDAKLKTIVAAICTRLAVPNGAGIYHVNTSGAGQVKRVLKPMDPIPRGWPFPHWQVVPLWRGDTEPGPTNQNYLVHGQVAILGYVASSAASTREDDAANMMHDGWNALALDFSLGGLIRNPIPRLWEVNGLEFDGAGKIGMCGFEYHFDFTSQIGTGT